MSAGTVNDGSAAADADGSGPVDAGATEGAADTGAALGPPPALHAARKAALADIVLAHMKPRRLSGVSASCFTSRSTRSIS